VDKSLKRLKLERIDLYQSHTVDRKVPIEDSVGALKKAQDAGKMGHVGLSNVSVKEIERAKRVVPIVSVQNRYNLTDRDSQDVLDYCVKEPPSPATAPPSKLAILAVTATLSHLQWCHSSLATWRLPIWRKLDIVCAPGASCAHPQPQ
jgi:predicted oxidoreductase